MSDGASASVSKEDPVLAKAEPISDGGSASGITQLGRGGGILQWDRGVRRCESNSPADPTVSAEGGQEVLQAPEQRFPPAMEQTVVGQAVPAAMEIHGRADPHPQPGDDPTPEQGGVWKRL